MKKTALITGVTGQDGSYLSELLLKKGYDVYGLVRRGSTSNTDRIKEPLSDPSFHLVYGDMTDSASIIRAINISKPDEIYNLAAQSHVGISFQNPIYTNDVVAGGALRVFDAAKQFQDQSVKEVRIYQAGSSEMFGSSPAPQSECTPFKPCSPYAVEKFAAHKYAIIYREAYGMFISNGLLYNHESFRRSDEFVTRKITKALARIKYGLQQKLFLGNLSSKRDWGYSKDFVRAMFLMLQHDIPDDFVVATGETHTVKEFLDKALCFMNVDHNCVDIDESLFRPKEVDVLLGDPSKANNVLGWKAEVGFNDLVEIMCKYDEDMSRKEAEHEKA